jgi:hypothetical protein
LIAAAAKAVVAAIAETAPQARHPQRIRPRQKTQTTRSNPASSQQEF